MKRSLILGKRSFIETFLAAAGYEVPLPPTFILPDCSLPQRHDKIRNDFDVTLSAAKINRTFQLKV